MTAKISLRDRIVVVAGLFFVVYGFLSIIVGSQLLRDVFLFGVLFVFIVVAVSLAVISRV